MDFLLDVDCGYCGEENISLFCGDCMAIGYCSEDCQQRDWKEHHKKEHEKGKLCPTEYSINPNDFCKVKTLEKDYTIYGLEPKVRLGRKARKRGRKGRGRTGRKKRKKKWIKKAIKRPGAFTAKAKVRGMSTTTFMRKVLANPKEYDTRTVRQANLMKTLGKF